MILKTIKRYICTFYRFSLHRQLLDDQLRRHAVLVSGKVLDVGSRNRRYDSLFKRAGEIIALDLHPQREDVLQGDVLDLPFSDEEFDTVMAFEVLEYIMDTECALRQMRRVLKKGGVMLFSVPFLNPVHGDVDNVRYTVKSWKILLEGLVEIEKIVCLGGRYSVMWDFFFEKVRNTYSRWGKIFLFPFLVSMKSLASYFDRREGNTRYPMGFFFVCKAE